MTVRSQSSCQETKTAESELGEVGPGFTPLDLIGQATLGALEDAGLDKSEVDGLFSASHYHHMPTLSVGEYLGIIALVHGCGGVLSSQVTAVLGSESTL